MPDIKHFALSTVVVATAAMLSVQAQAADLNSEIMNARMHAGLAAQAADLATVQAHLHHTINCLVGPKGAGYDSKQLNPCQNNGDGAIPDETDAAKKKALQAAADKATSGLGASDLATARSDASSVATMLGSVK